MVILTSLLSLSSSLHERVTGSSVKSVPAVAVFACGRHGDGDRSRRVEAAIDPYIHSDPRFQKPRPPKSGTQIGQRARGSRQSRLWHCASRAPPDLVRRRASAMKRSGDSQDFTLESIGTLISWSWVSPSRHVTRPVTGVKSSPGVAGGRSESSDAAVIWYLTLTSPEAPAMRRTGITASWLCCVDADLRFLNAENARSAAGIAQQAREKWPAPE